MKKILSAVTAGVMSLMGAAAAAPAPSEIAVPDFKTYVFEGSVPGEFSADAGSKLSISDKYYRGGGKASLRWDWDVPGATFTYRHPEAFKHLTGENPDPVVYEYVTCTTISSFSIWVFNETPSTSPLFFEIGDGKAADSRFWMNLNFTGWKELAFLYGRDLTGFPNQKTADTLRVIAPDTPAGSLYFSHFSPRRETDIRLGLCEVAPWVGMRDSHRLWCVGGLNIGQLNFGVNNAPRASIPLPENLDSGQLELLRKLTYTYFGPINIVPKKVTVEEAAKLRDSITSKYDLKRQGRFVSGSLPAPGDFQAVANLHAAAEGQSGSQEILLRLFTDMISLEACTTRGMIGFMRAILMMKESLRRSGEWERLYAKCVAGSSDKFYEVKPWCNADIFNTYFAGMVGFTLLRDDCPEKWRDLMAMRRWLEICAVNGSLQSDGSFFHHSMIYNGYSVPAMPPLAKALALIHGTPFEATKMEEVVKRAAKAMAFYSCPGHIPHVLCGRHRAGISLNWGYFKSVLLPLANCGQPVDKEMASLLMAYAELWPKESDNDPDVIKLKGMGIKPASFDGHMPLNYACAGIQRRDDWMLLVRGQKKGFLANEIYAMDGSNTMGRFVTNGHIIFQSPDTLNFHFLSGPSGKGVQGWNWALWPGTTSRLLPHDALRTRFELVEAVTPEPFCGDTALDGNGVWGMKLREEVPGSQYSPNNIGPVKYWIGEKLYTQLIKDGHYDKDFLARKSVFMFDDRVICLGSGIKSSDSFPSVTTLFQNSLAKEGMKGKFAMSGNTDAAFPIEKNIEGSCWLTDSNGIGYFVPAGNDALRIERKLQKLPFHLFWTFHNPENQAKAVANEGETEFAYLNHGLKPENGSYEYAMLIKATPERMENLAKLMVNQSSVVSRQSLAGKNQNPIINGRQSATGDQRPYAVLRRDNIAHVVRDTSSKTTGYVIFEKDKEVGAGIVSVSAPCIVMVKEAGDGKLKLSYCNPDLGKGEARGESNETEQVASIKLKDAWEIAGEAKAAKTETKDDLTEIIFRTFGSKPAEIELSPVK